MPEILNLFMNAKFHEDGTYKFAPPFVRAGDYIDLTAEMDCLAAISACPDDLSAYNEHTPKRLKVEILE